MFSFILLICKLYTHHIDVLSISRSIRFISKSIICRGVWYLFDLDTSSYKFSWFWAYDWCSCPSQCIYCILLSILFHSMWTTDHICDFELLIVILVPFLCNSFKTIKLTVFISVGWHDTRVLRRGIREFSWQQIWWVGELTSRGLTLSLIMTCPTPQTLTFTG